MTIRPSSDRAQTLAEEVANAVSHGIGLLLAAASLPVVVWFAARHGDAANVVAASVFSATMLLLYAVSTLYHALPHGRTKRVFNRLDHAAIYVFIAGSYTPFTLGVLRGGWGWSLFGLVWACAAAGVALKLFNRLSQPWLSTGLYVAMGWLVLIAIVPLVQRIAPAGLAWLVAGGLLYTLGAVFYLFDSRFAFAHTVWHLFVLGGSASHFFAVLWHAA